MYIISDINQEMVQGFLPDINIKRGDLENESEDEGEILEGQSNENDLDEAHECDLDLEDVNVELEGATDGGETVDEEVKKSESESSEEVGSKEEQSVTESKVVPKSGATSLTLSLSDSASRPQHGMTHFMILKIESVVFAFLIHPTSLDMYTDCTLC